MQVLLNLLANAVKFCAPGAGRVRVTLAHGREAVRVDVADNGVGIAPEHQAAIFEKFHQVGDTLTEKPQGTGLGLPISRRSSGSSAASCGSRAQPGRGATFSFTIPVAQGRAEEARWRSGS